MVIRDIFQYECLILSQIMRTKLGILFLFSLFVIGCRQSKYVPEKMYLLKKNTITLNKDKLLLEDLEYTFRQKPNVRFLGVPFKLHFYNVYDSARLAENHSIRVEKFEKKLIKKRNKIEKTNARRKAKAIQKNKDYYIPKTLKDTLYTKRSFPERLKYVYGQSPVVFDTLLTKKTEKQMSLLLKKKGYFENEVQAEVFYNTKKRYAYVNYKIGLGELYTIDSLKFEGIRTLVKLDSIYMLNTEKELLEHPLINKPLDVEILDEHRYAFARFMKNSGYHNFQPTSMYFKIDTNGLNRKAIVYIHFDLYPEVLDLRVKDSLNARGIKPTAIGNVFFHLADTLHYPGNFKKDYVGYTLENPIAKQFVITTKDTYYNKVLAKKTRLDKFSDLKKGDPDPFMEITVNYNGNKPWIKPELLALQTYLEHRNTFKQDYLDRSFRSLQLLNVFSNIKPILIKTGETSKSNIIDVHYFLEPSKKHTFGFEPKFTTNTSGLLGMSAGINYSNKNFGRKAQSLTLSFGGGFESQTRSLSSEEDVLFNTIEIGPSIKFETPGLLPVPIYLLSKRQRPRTVISSSFNLEKRAIFNREVFQLTSYWKFYVGKTQIFQIGLPGISTIKYVLFNPKGTFQDYLNNVDDPFFRNTYSKQFIWEDFRLSWEYNNKEKNYRPGKRPLFNANIYFQTTFDAAGNALRAFKGIQELNSEGEYQFLNVSYSQFVRLDNLYILGKRFKHKKSIHFKYNLGAGMPYLNSTTSMPYDFSFFAGGSNDNRGFRARTLGPGAYAYHLDPLRLPTQVGDIRFLSSVEYRFNIGSIFRGALFSDVGNIWTFREDPNRVKGNFEFKDFYQELALSGGVGLRLDFDFFVFRLDLSFPMYNPAFSAANKWFFTDLFTNENYRKGYYSEGVSTFENEVNQIYFDQNGTFPTSDQYWKLIKEYKLMPKPFVPMLNFGIGYPF